MAYLKRCAEVQYKDNSDGEKNQYAIVECVLRGKPRKKHFFLWIVGGQEV